MNNHASDIFLNTLRGIFNGQHVESYLNVCNEPMETFTLLAIMLFYYFHFVVVHELFMVLYSTTSFCIIFLRNCVAIIIITIIFASIFLKILVVTMKTSQSAISCNLWLN